MTADQKSASHAHRRSKGNQSVTAATIYTTSTPIGTGNHTAVYTLFERSRACNAAAANFVREDTKRASLSQHGGERWDLSLSSTWKTGLRNPGTWCLYDHVAANCNRAGCRALALHLPYTSPFLSVFPSVFLSVFPSVFPLILTSIFPFFCLLSSGHYRHTSHAGRTIL